MSDEPVKTIGRPFEPGNTVGVTAGKPFTKGFSGNPAGRPKGLERRLREKFGDDLDELTRIQVQIAKGVIPPGTDIQSISAADCTRAYVAVTDRLMGKPKQETKVESDLNIGPKIPMNGLKREQLEALAALSGLGPDGAPIH